MLRRAAVLKRICDRRRAQNAIVGKYTNLCAISGTDFRKWGEEDDDETNNQRYDRDWFSGS